MLDIGAGYQFMTNAVPSRGFHSHRGPDEGHAAQQAPADGAMSISNIAPISGTHMGDPYISQQSTSFTNNSSSGTHHPQCTTILGQEFDINWGQSSSTYVPNDLRVENPSSLSHLQVPSQFNAQDEFARALQHLLDVMRTYPGCTSNPSGIPNNASYPQHFTGHSWSIGSSMPSMPVQDSVRMTISFFSNILADETCLTRSLRHAFSRGDLVGSQYWRIRKPSKQHDCSPSEPTALPAVCHRHGLIIVVHITCFSSSCPHGGALPPPRLCRHMVRP